MPTDKDIDRIAILLHGIGDEMADAALSRLDGATAEQVRARLQSYAGGDSDPDQLNYVLEDFERFMRFALETFHAPTAFEDDEFEEESETAPLPPPPRPKLTVFNPSDDPIADLNRFRPVQLAAAVVNEHPRTISIVLTSLPNDRAAEILALLPDETRTQAFFAVQNPSVIPDELRETVARKTVERAALIEPADLDAGDDLEKTAALLRAVPNPIRGQLVESLEKEDAETAERLLDLLFLFEDIVRYDGRAIQKVLGQVETRDLVLALQHAEEEVSEAIMGNLSKRAVASLKEEMEFSQGSKQEEIDEARVRIGRTIAKLNRSGEITEME